MEELTPAGERLLTTARDVFYAEGIRAVGVDTLVAAAGVSKPTLYAQFGSKDVLVAAVLQRRREDRRHALEQYLAGPDAEHGADAGVPWGSEERIGAVFTWLAAGHGRSGFRGCPFTNAAVELPDPEHPARSVISGYKRWLRSVFARLAAEAGLVDPDDLADALLLLVDGANARVVVDDDRDAMRRAGRTAARLVAAHRPAGAAPQPRGAARTDTTAPTGITMPSHEQREEGP